MATLYKVCWKLNGKKGEGKFTADQKAILAWVQECNHKYGKNTHWIKTKESK